MSLSEDWKLFLFLSRQFNPINYKFRIRHARFQKITRKSYKLFCLWTRDRKNKTDYPHAKKRSLLHTTWLLASYFGRGKIKHEKNGKWTQLIKVRLEWTTLERRQENILEKKRSKREFLRRFKVRFHALDKWHHYCRLPRGQSNGGSNALLIQI